MAATAAILNFEDYRLHAFQRHGSKLPWFALMDVCKVFELRGKSAANDLADRLDDDEKGTVTIGTAGGSQQMLVVSLSGLTRLSGASRKPIAKRFNKWLHSDVVVSLFLTGEFKGDTSPLDDLVGTFQPLLNLPEPTTKPAEVVPFPKGEIVARDVERDDRGLPKVPPWTARADPKTTAEANRRFLDVISEIGPGYREPELPLIDDPVPPLDSERGYNDLVTGGRYRLDCGVDDEGDLIFLWFKDKQRTGTTKIFRIKIADDRTGKQVYTFCDKSMRADGISRLIDRCCRLSEQMTHTLRELLIDQ